MSTKEKLSGLLSFSSNSPGVPTGYGQQAEQLVDRMVRDGLTVAVMSNYGHEGAIGNYKTKTKKIPHYPRSFTGYSDDILPIQHNHFRQKYPDLAHSIFILYDSWVYKNPALNDIPIISYAPLDHVTLPPMVNQFLRKDNVTPVAMAPHGQRQLAEHNIEAEYIPHTVDTSVYKPTKNIRQIPAREFLGIKESDFLVGMVAANKSNGSIHRKAFAENLLGFAMFQKKFPDAKLYIHSEASKAMGGFDLATLLKATGVPADAVMFPDPLDLRYGFDQKVMAGLYSTMDVLLTPSYGEGFGVPTIEAQACGTKVIGSNWAATPDLVSESGFLVDGTPFWDEAQASWFKIPNPENIARALQMAYESERGVDQVSIDFAGQFETEKVWREKWLPFFRKYYAE